MNRETWLQGHNSKQHGRSAYAIKGHRVDFKENILKVLHFFKSVFSERAPHKLISKTYKNALYEFYEYSDCLDTMKNLIADVQSVCCM